MQQRLGFGSEDVLEPLRLDLQVAVGAQLGDRPSSWGEV
jgi:hypothetical protein